MRERIAAIELIKSISYDQGEILRNILTLYVPSGKIDVDPTYSKGVFYSGTGIEQPTFKSDLFPVFSDVIEADCRALPIASNSVNCVIFDPPFLAATGRYVSDDNNSSQIVKRFGAYRTERELHQFYIDSMREAYRILQKNGILIFKCQDKVSQRKQYMSHVFVMDEAVKLGFFVEDLFILLARTRIYSEEQLKNQHHARKFHCYFWVFRKCDRKVQFIEGA